MVEDDRVTSAVERLRDATRNREAVAGNILRAKGRESTTQVASEYQETLRGIEDSAIKVLGDLFYPLESYDRVPAAIERAGADWLYPIILDRALEAVGFIERPGGDA
jgi:hypothetical protein